MAAFTLRRTASLLLLSASALVVGCATRKPQVETSHSSPSELGAVARHRTYAVEVSETPPKGYSSAARSKVVLEKAQPVVAAELAKKGYVSGVVGEAELIVRLSAGVHEVADHPVGAMNAAGAPSEIDEVSTLFVDILDAKTKATLFSGTAKKEIHSAKVKDEDVTRAVAEILEPIPAAAPAP